MVQYFSELVIPCFNSFINNCYNYIYLYNNGLLYANNLYDAIQIISLKLKQRQSFLTDIVLYTKVHTSKDR